MIFWISPTETEGTAGSIAKLEATAAFILWREVMSLTMLMIRERAWAATDEDIETLTGGGKKPISTRENVTKQF
jgi:hypothetical protein